MQKVIYIFIFLIPFVFTTQAQKRFRAGLKAGVSTTQVDGDTYGGFDKAGFVGGVTLNGKINEKWKAQFEILFVQKGSKHVGNAEKGDYSFYLMQLNYLEVPILLQYQQKKFTFEIGPGIGYLISSKEEDAAGKLNHQPPFYTTEVSGSLGINYQIYKNLGINWRFTNSLLPIRKFSSGASTFDKPGQMNNVLAFTLTYRFGDPDEQ